MSEESDEVDDIGEHIRGLRKDHHLTQKALGDLLGLPQSRISDLETGDIPRNIIELCSQIADKLKLEKNEREQLLAITKQYGKKPATRDKWKATLKKGYLQRISNKTASIRLTSGKKIAPIRQANVQDRLELLDQSSLRQATQGSLSEESIHAGELLLEARVSAAIVGACRQWEIDAISELNRSPGERRFGNCNTCAD